MSTVCAKRPEFSFHFWVARAATSAATAGIWMVPAVACIWGNR